MVRVEIITRASAMPLAHAHKVEPQSKAVFLTSTIFIIFSDWIFLIKDQSKTEKHILKVIGCGAGSI